MLSIPARCWLCQMPLTLAIHGLCSSCTRALTQLKHRCPRCGLPARTAPSPCGRCVAKPPPWQQMVAVGDYQRPLSALVHQFKFSGGVALASPLARLLLLSVLAARRERALLRPDLIISVPLALRRQWRRGFNQSALLAKPVAHWLGCEHWPDALRRTRAGRLQHHLSARQRAANLKNAFRLELPVAGRHIAIVDDVITTGSTVGEIAGLLKRHGAAAVQVWCLCRTL
ncbi:DNA utilization protein GntX [Erwinia sp. CPCC 100877]|nr:DNA utilization protein GntX [Erwinia sp. CPCC 100877]